MFDDSPDPARGSGFLTRDEFRALSDINQAAVKQAQLDAAVLGRTRGSEIKGRRGKELTKGPQKARTRPSPGKAQEAALEEESERAWKQASEEAATRPAEAAPELTHGAPQEQVHGATQEGISARENVCDGKKREGNIARMSPPGSELVPSDRPSTLPLPSQLDTSSLAPPPRTLPLSSIPKAWLSALAKAGGHRKSSTQLVEESDYNGTSILTAAEHRLVVQNWTTGAGDADAEPDADGAVRQSKEAKDAPGAAATAPRRTAPNLRPTDSSAFEAFGHQPPGAKPVPFSPSEVTSLLPLVALDRRRRRELFAAAVARDPAVLARTRHVTPRQRSQFAETAAAAKRTLTQGWARGGIEKGRDDGEAGREGMRKRERGSGTGGGEEQEEGRERNGSTNGQRGKGETSGAASEMALRAPDAVVSATAQERRVTRSRRRQLEAGGGVTQALDGEARTGTNEPASNVGADPGGGAHRKDRTAVAKSTQPRQALSGAVQTSNESFRAAATLICSPPLPTVVEGPIGKIRLEDLFTTPDRHPSSVSLDQRLYSVAPPSFPNALAAFPLRTDEADADHVFQPTPTAVAASAGGSCPPPWRPPPARSLIPASKRFLPAAVTPGYLVRPPPDAAGLRRAAPAISTDAEFLRWADADHGCCAAVAGGWLREVAAWAAGGRPGGWEALLTVTGRKTSGGGSDSSTSEQTDLSSAPWNSATVLPRTSSAFVTLSAPLPARSVRLADQHRKLFKRAALFAGAQEHDRAPERVGASGTSPRRRLPRLPSLRFLPRTKLGGVWDLGAVGRVAVRFHAHAAQDSVGNVDAHARERKPETTRKPAASSTPTSAHLDAARSGSSSPNVSSSTALSADSLSPALPPYVYVAPKLERLAGEEDEEWTPGTAARAAMGAFLLDSANRLLCPIRSPSPLCAVSCRVVTGRFGSTSMHAALPPAEAIRRGYAHAASGRLPDLPIPNLAPTPEPQHTGQALGAAWAVLAGIVEVAARSLGDGTYIISAPEIVTGALEGGGWGVQSGGKTLPTLTVFRAVDSPGKEEQEETEEGGSKRDTDEGPRSEKEEDRKKDNEKCVEAAGEPQPSKGTSQGHETKRAKASLSSSVLGSGASVLPSSLWPSSQCPSLPPPDAAAALPLLEAKGRDNDAMHGRIRIVGAPYFTHAAASLLKRYSLHAAVQTSLRPAPDPAIAPIPTWAPADPSIQQIPRTLTPRDDDAALPRARAGKRRRRVETPWAWGVLGAGGDLDAAEQGLANGSRGSRNAAQERVRERERYHAALEDELE